MGVITEPPNKVVSYSIRRASYLPMEGAGVNGVFTIRGSAALRGNGVFVSAMGNTPIMLPYQNRGGVHFYANASLLDGSRLALTRQLLRNGNGIWPDNDFTPIGSTVLPVPSYLRDKPIQVKIVGGYEFRSSHGVVTPVPGTVSTTITVGDSSHE